MECDYLWNSDSAVSESSLGAWKALSKNSYKFVVVAVVAEGAVAVVEEENFLSQHS